MRTAEGSVWFRRFRRELRKISPHYRLVRLKMGFYRIYWKNAYIHEVYKEMPQKGYDIEIEDPRIENKQYFQEFEDEISLIRTIKNFVEGYYDSLDTIKTRAYMLKNNDEFRQKAFNAYKQLTIK
jgi:hypothetical protein